MSTLSGTVSMPLFGCSLTFKVSSVAVHFLRTTRQKFSHISSHPRLKRDMQRLSKLASPSYLVLAISCLRAGEGTRLSAFCKTLRLSTTSMVSASAHSLTSTECVTMTLLNSRAWGDCRDNITCSCFIFHPFINCMATLQTASQRAHCSSFFSSPPLSACAK